MIRPNYKSYFSYLFGLTVIILAFTIYFFKLSANFYPDTDFARDAYNVIKICQGKFTFIGPSLRIGVFSGPYYYYLFAPALCLSNYNSDWILYFNAALFIIGLVITFSVLNRRVGLYSAFVSTISVALLPFYISSARHPGNAYSLLPFLLVYILLYLYLRVTQINLFLMGLLGGLIFNFHPASALATLPLLYFFHRRSRLTLSHLAFYCFGFLLTLAPIAVFELRHHFVVIKGLLVSQNYSYFINGKHLAVYYFNSLALTIFFLLVLRLSQTKVKLISLLVILVLFVLFPRNLYQPSPKHLADVELQVRQIISSGLINHAVSFNLISVADEKLLVPMGHDYRFAFYKYGFKPLDENNYSSADILLIFSHIGPLDLSHFTNWETAQYGQTYITSASVHTYSGTTLYVASKK